MPTNVVTTTLYIDNMTCVNCENTIERALSSKVGVESVKASYSSGTVTVTYNPDEIQLEEIQKLIEEHDYHAQRRKISKSDRKTEKPFDLINI